MTPTILNRLIGLICLVTLAAPATMAQNKTTAKPPVKPLVGTTKPATPVTPPKQEYKVGFPQDAQPHDNSNMEWWYFNTFLKSETGRNIAVVGSFFRTGLTPTKKGHYLIFSIVDLDAKQRKAVSILDRNEISLLRALMPIMAQQRPDDPRPLRLLRLLQRGELPAPHRDLNYNAVVQQRTKDRPDALFSIAFENNTLSQVSADGRTWKVQLNSEDGAFDLTLTQPTRPAMLPGGLGLTGIKRPEDFYYLSLTRMEATATLTSDDGVVEKLSGDGWLDRQWGSPDFVASYGWDWLGLQLDNGDDLILDRIRDLATGKVVKYRATVLERDGKQTVDNDMEMKPTGETWRDPATGITFPAGFTINLPNLGYKLTVTPTFPDQTIPVIGVGDAIWEGVVKVDGTNKEGNLLTGRGFLEMVGYHR